MSDTIDFSKLLLNTEDTTQITNDVQQVQEILNTTASQVSEKQDAVLSNQERQVAAANKEVQQDARLANLIMDEQLVRDQKLSQQWKQLDQIADPVEQARQVQAKYDRLQQASNQYANDQEEANSLNPLVGIPAAFRARFSEAAMQGAARDLKLQVEGFGDIQAIRAAALSNYQTRSQLLTKERVEATKELNELKAAHSVITNKGKLAATDLQFTMDRFGINERKRDGLIKTLNSKIQGKQLQLAAVQSIIEAEMMPLRLEQMQMQTEAMRDNMDRRKSIEAQYSMKYPDTNIRPNWWEPSVQASMSKQELARLQEVITSSQFGTDEKSFTSALVSAQTGTNQQAAEYIAMAEEMRDAYNNEAMRVATQNDPLAAKTFVKPLDPKDPNYAAKMDVFMRNQQTIAEDVDATRAVENGYVVLESLKTMIGSGEVNLNDAVRSGAISSDVAEFLEKGDFDLVISGSGSNKQASTALEQLYTAAVSHSKQTGKELSSADLAQGFTFWSNVALQRSNASPNTAMNLTKLTLPTVDAFSSKRGLFERYELENKPLTVTDMNQVIARFDALRKRRQQFKQRTDIEATRDARAAKAYQSMSPSVGITDSSPYSWLKVR